MTYFVKIHADRPDGRLTGYHITWTTRKTEGQGISERVQRLQATRKQLLEAEQTVLHDGIPIRTALLRWEILPPGPYQTQLLLYGNTNIVLGKLQTRAGDLPSRFITLIGQLKREHIKVTADCLGLSLEAALAEL
ncbi:MAG TPA: hypothetical protein VJB87_01830 [Candidatus Nanoarchaeia archaeon]|nr:hypothetical protein [Candidatus Nanoarchaeia archaeon]